MIADLVQFESIADIDPEPRTWSEAIDAIIAGAIDHDEIEPLLTIAAGRADEVARERFHYTGYSDSVDEMVDALEAAAITGKKLHYCDLEALGLIGTLADEWEAQQK